MEIPENMGIRLLSEVVN